MSNIYNSVQQLSRVDLVRQGHVTMSVTFCISGSNDARTMIFFCFAGFEGQ